MDMLSKYVSIAKIAYLKGKPIAQLLYYPEVVDPTGPRRGNVLVVHCIYNSFPWARRKRAAKKLMESLISEVKREAKYDFLITYVFETGEYYPQRLLFEKIGFKRIPRGGEGILLPLKGELTLEGTSASLWREPGEYCVRSEDKGKALIFYTPVCQFSYIFAYKAAQIIRELSLEIPIHLVNSWKQPEMYISRGETGL